MHKTQALGAIYLLVEKDRQNKLYICFYISYIYVYIYISHVVYTYDPAGSEGEKIWSQIRKAADMFLGGPERSDVHTEG